MPLRPRLIVKSAYMRPTFRGGPWGGEGGGDNIFPTFDLPHLRLAYPRRQLALGFLGLFILASSFSYSGEILKISPFRPRTSKTWECGGSIGGGGGGLANFSSPCSGGRTRGHVSESPLGFEGLGSTLIFPHLKNFSLVLSNFLSSSSLKPETALTMHAFIACWPFSLSRVRTSKVQCCKTDPNCENGSN